MNQFSLVWQRFHDPVSSQVRALRLEHMLAAGQRLVELPLGQALTCDLIGGAAAAIRRATAAAAKERQGKGENNY